MRLTLSIPDHLILAAKKEAANRGVSVSKLVSDYFIAFEKKPVKKEKVKFSPFTESLRGILKKGSKRNFNAKNV